MNDKAHNPDSRGDSGEVRKAAGGKLRSIPRESPYNEGCEVGTMRVMQRLVNRKDWTLPEDALTAIPAKLSKLALDATAADRSVIGASRVLVSMTRASVQRDSAEFRINVPLAIRQEEPPTAPDDFDYTEQVAFFEDVKKDDLAETAAVLDGLGLLPRFIDQIQGNVPDEPPHNGNGQPRLSKDDRFHAEE